MDKSQRKGWEKHGKKQLERLYKKAIRDPSMPGPARDGLEAIWKSHAVKGQEYRRQGKLREAIEEFRKDTEKVIRDPGQAEVPQTAFCLMGDTFVELGELENALNAYEKALELWYEYSYGHAPHVDLARVFLKQGRIDDAIAICEEFFRTSPELIGWGVRQVLEEARRQKSLGE